MVSPDNVTDFNCFATKPVVRTADNPTLTKARASSNWLDWKIAVDAEMRLLSPEDLHCYDTVRRSEIPKGTHLLHGKMDLKTKFTTVGEFLKHKARLVCLGSQSREARSHSRSFQSHGQQQDHQPYVCTGSATRPQASWPGYLWSVHHSGHRGGRIALYTCSCLLVFFLTSMVSRLSGSCARLSTVSVALPKLSMMISANI